MKKINIQLFDKGIENREKILAKDFTKMRNFKLIFYYIIIGILSPKIDGTQSKILIINGKSERGFNFSCGEDNKIYRGNCYNSISEIWKLPTFFCAFTFFQRLRLLKKSILSYLKDKRGINELSFWIEYNIIYAFFEKSCLREVVSRGHYDEITTWIGEISKLLGFEFIIYQHGIIKDTIKIPHKIYCNKFYGFDNYSIETFEKNYISNKSCEYCLFDFKSSVHFEKIAKMTNTVYIGIAEQRNIEWTNKIIDLILAEGIQCQVIVMLHPLSKGIYKKENIIIERKSKISNIDILLTESSTLALDYYKANCDVKIVYTSKEMKNCFLDYPFEYVESTNQLINIIKEIRKNRV